MTMYYIAVVLPQHLNEKVLGLKQYMLDRYQCKVALKSPAHITIIPPFWLNPERERTLITDVDAFSQSIKLFSIQTNNFSAFKPRTIFIAVKENDHLNELKKSTDRYFSTKDYDIKEENRAFHPHITIATRDLFKKDFAEAWPHFENKTFQEQWDVTGLALLRHNKKNWDVIYTSQFQKHISK